MYGSSLIFIVQTQEWYQSSHVTPGKKADKHMLILNLEGGVFTQRYWRVAKTYKERAGRSGQICVLMDTSYIHWRFHSNFIKNLKTFKVRRTANKSGYNKGR